MNMIEDAIKAARKYYDESTYYHVMRVAGYVVNDNLIPKDKMERCVALAIMHDLQEDTEFNYQRDSANNAYDSYTKRCLELLTRDTKKNL